MPLLLKLVPGVLLLISTVAMAGDVYQWKDAGGRPVYSDQPPPPGTPGVAVRPFRPGLITPAVTAADRAAQTRSPITLFATDCGAPCELARQLLETRGVPFSSKNPQTDAAQREALFALTGKASVPVLIVGKEKLEGFEAGQWNAALDRAGYRAGKKPPAAAASS